MKASGINVSKEVKYLFRKIFSHLELACLSVEGETVEDHGTDEGDVCGLAVVDPLPRVHPETSELGEDLDCLECLEIVDENVGNPEVIYQLQIN